MRKEATLFTASIGALFLAAMAGPVVAADSFADDRAKIENLQARYMFAMDWRDADAYASCFTEDGVLDYAGGVEKGRAAIRKMIVDARAREEQRATEKPGLRPARTRHNITNVYLKIDGNKAIGRAYWVAFSNNNDKRSAEISSYGHYEDELVKQNGEWLFSKRVILNEQLDKRAATSKTPW